MRWLTIIAVLAFFIVASSCYDPRAQESPIVREAMANGAGDLRVSDVNGLKMFFEQHEELSKKINGECASILPSVDAHWINTAEGRVCLAAHSVYVNIPTDWKADQRKW